MASNYEQIRRDNLKEYGEGTRHLAFFGQLYTGRTHFVVELLQNAEDAQATRIKFHLHKDRLEVSHDGRPFDEKDVRGICGVDEGTKAGDLTQIGKFGIGFKSVYAYTSSPEIHLGGEHFSIEHYVRPVAAIPRAVDSPWTTLFVFPFNHREVRPTQAATEIQQRLQTLNARSLLFLRSLTDIEWEVINGPSGTYLREAKPRAAARLVTVLGQSSKQDEEELWITFSRLVPLPGQDVNLNVEVAFQLATPPNTDKSMVVRASNTELVVFFPTEKETHLGFLMQGPYRTTPARDNVPQNIEFNRLLVEETAILVADSLRNLRNLGLLTVSLLETLPVRHSDFPEGNMFRPIFDRVREALQEQRALPTHSNEHASGRRVKLARGAEMLELLTPKQLGDLLDSEEEVYWLSGEITENRTPDLYRYLVGRKARYRGDPDVIDPLVEDLEFRPEALVRHLTVGFLAKQNDKWIAKLYAFLGTQRDLWNGLRNLPIIRLEDGSHVPPTGPDGQPHIYLPPNGSTDLPMVKRAIVSEQSALQFLKDLGLSEPDVVAEVLEKVLPKYESDSIDIAHEEHQRDIATILRAVQEVDYVRRHTLADKIQKVFWLKGRNVEHEEWYASPIELYIRDRQLEMYFEGNPDTYFLDEDCTDKQLAELMKRGIATSVRVSRQPADYDGHVTVASFHGYHRRGLNGFDPNSDVDGLDNALEHITVEKARFIWNELLVPNNNQILGGVEFSTRQSFQGSSIQQELSALGRKPYDAKWLPDKRSELHKPNELSIDELPEGFTRDTTLATALDLKAAQATEVNELLAQAIGVQSDDIDFLQTHPEEFAA